MNLIETALEGVYIIEPKVFSDPRGYFFESYNQDKFKKAGLDYVFVQDNQSKSSYGTIRGIHFQTGKHAQTKLVWVLQGTVLDIAVDLRVGSPTFGQHVAVELSGENYRQLLIPRGFGHGFSVLSETAVFSYKCDNFYMPSSEGSVRFDDPDLAIDWRVDRKRALLSEKDKTAPDFQTYCRSPIFHYLSE
ncbi:dTDP-4-dehydrorhamnose 3,5-epimerase [Oxalobacter paraformigenes]|uniref:dTDP-4-dehydrorhamnose 3,5-epimerase n=1 Tax=Oxalobacter paraformigenes TaxID=556268 RepID=C3X285_9BURK|nr:dTDP-4-dehydrorhamnose 3,5-epimerase [Oxalobacter paraformigenes]EEO27321.1 dTDP-4-dehydrorhamnose 3,5-epimerase [Oxalobacter paraformigenes]